MKIPALIPLGLMGLISIALKLCGVVTWSWWWVIAPFWVGWVTIIVIACVFVWIELVHVVLSSARFNGHGNKVRQRTCRY